MWIEVDRAVPCSMLIWRRSRICLTSPAERPIHPHRRIGNIKRCLGPSRTGISARHDKSRKKFPHLNPFPKGEAEEANATALFFLDSWIPGFLIQFLGKEKCRPASAGRHFLVDVQQRLNCALPSRVSLGSGFFRFQSLHGISNG